MDEKFPRFPINLDGEEFDPDNDVSNPYDRSSYDSRIEQDMTQRMAEKLRRQDGIIVGTHGTSGSRARKILEEGFVDSLCIEGGYAGTGERGVYFWDDDFGNNASIHARYKAIEDGDSQMAIITARLKNPSVDMGGRPQWFARSEKIEEIIGVEFIPLKNE